MDVLGIAGLVDDPVHLHSERKTEHAARRDQHRREKDGPVEFPRLYKIGRSAGHGGQQHQQSHQTAGEVFGQLETAGQQRADQDAAADAEHGAQQPGGQPGSESDPPHPGSQRRQFVVVAPGAAAQRLHRDRQDHRAEHEAQRGRAEAVEEPGVDRFAGQRGQHRTGSERQCETASRRTRPPADFRKLPDHGRQRGGSHLQQADPDRFKR